MAQSLQLVQALQARWGARLIETHISWVLLDGTHAWKLKKPVSLPFLDATEPATRLRLCEAECTLNRRLAPELYLGVMAVRGTPQDPQVGPLGKMAEEADDAPRPPLDYLLQMKQFPPGALFSERIAAGTLTPAHIDALAERLARFQAEAPVAPADTTWGRPALIEAQWAQLLDGLAATGCPDEAEGWRAWVAEMAPVWRPHWQARADGGRVREGHGDLHLANLIAWREAGEAQDRVTAFDGIEFDPALRWVDTALDTAFTAMDLFAHQRPDLAWRFLNAWLDASGEHACLPVWRGHLVYRALVRAMVGRLQGGTQHAGAPDYLDAAHRLSAPGPASLLITHGLSGSGKSFQSQRLLEAHGAIRVRADVERKRLFGLAPLAPSHGRVPDGIYTPEASERSYTHLLALADQALCAGYPVIVDAAFLKRHERDRFRQLAQQRGVPFGILHCEAPEVVLRARIRSRQAEGRDPSEATEAVMFAQRQSAEPLDAAEMPWVRQVQP
jgi:aminoglycoside phosphotransferase family enzyme/predicted kinase